LPQESTTTTVPPIINEVAFDIGRRYSLKYAYITADSYRGFIDYLGIDWKIF
jgi:hypothetical protein